jgi:4,5-dihydroxyphthalate decarboxylase
MRTFMANLHLSVSCGDYDRTRFLIDGKVPTPGLDLTVIPLPSVDRHARFSRSLEFDVCELQMGVYLGWKSRGIPVTAIPVFPHVKFCHGSVVVHSKSGIERPEDLRGKRVGIQAHFNPIALWMRGVLKHEHSVGPDAIHWVTNASEQVTPWDAPKWLHIERAPSGRRVPEMLDVGDLDAYMLPTLGASFRVGKSPGRRLWPNYREVETDYYQRTGIYPIRHTVVVKDAILERNPWVAACLVRAFDDAKQLGMDYMRDQRKSYLAWYGETIEREDELFGRDPFPYSVAAQRTALETMLGYAEEQAITTRKLTVEELFVASTLD